MNDRELHNDREGIMDPAFGAVAYHNYTGSIGQPKVSKPAEKSRTFTLPSVLQRFKYNGYNNEVEPSVSQRSRNSATSDRSVHHHVKSTSIDLDDLDASPTELTLPQNLKEPASGCVTPSSPALTEDSLPFLSRSVEASTLDKNTLSPATIAERSASVPTLTSTNSVLHTIPESLDNTSVSSSTADTSVEASQAEAGGKDTNIKSPLMANPTITLTRSYAVMTVDALYKKYPEAVAELSVLKRHIQQGEIQAIEEIQALHEILHENSFGANVETERLEVENHHLKKRLEHAEALLEGYSVYKAHYEESRKLSESYFGGGGENSKDVHDYGSAVIYQAKKVIITKNPVTQVDKK
ncbi:hypothetical protein B7494_g3999 [Chlorociboria aeruginascens]|nr:hypothetical protein B7494_g3999 [Chlorociboria aeruginascens]